MKFIINLFLFCITYSNAISWLHISDIHLDTRYNIGSANKCLVGTKLGTLCCRKYDIPLNNSQPCNKYGDLNNDVPVFLLDSIVKWIKDNIEFDFIINTGDSGSHHDIEQVFTNDNFNSIKEVSYIFDKYYPNVPIYNIVGNHDSYPNVDQTFPGYKNFLKETTNFWKKWIEDINLVKYGYYSKNINNNIKIIGMNSLYYDTNNLFQVNDYKKDIEVTNGQFLWLKNELNDSRIKKQKVLFLNHIPLMGSESNNYMNTNLASILENNNDIIIANLYGHSHKSRFTLYKKNNKFISYGLINPSIYTDQKYPQFRIYNYKNNILNFKEYYCNLTYIIENDDFKCEYSYDFLEEYGIDTINLSNLTYLYEKFKINKLLLNKYKKHYSPPQNNNKINYISEILNRI